MDECHDTLLAVQVANRMKSGLRANDVDVRNARRSMAIAAKAEEGARAQEAVALLVAVARVLLGVRVVA